ncbi:MAG: tetratricopeptide repeat protein, partial [Bacteroidota bacterium]
MSNSTHFFSKAILIFCLAICFSLPQLKAQKAVYDSLYQVYLTETNDSIKSATLSRVIRWMIRTDPDSAIVLANRNIAYGENNQLALIIGQGKLDIAQASVRLGKYEESLALNEEAKAIFEAYPDSNLLSVAYQGIGISYRHLGRFEAAMRAQHRVIEIREKIGGSPQPLARAYNNIASIYTEIGENPKALDYFQKSLDIWRKEKNPESMAICYINMGAQAIFMDSLPLAETYLRRGYQTFDSLGLKYGTGAASANLGKLYMDKGMWSEAKEQYQAALKSYEDLGDIGRQAMFLSDLGLIESELKNFSQAVAYQETSLKKAKEAKRITAIRDSYERLADLYEEAGQYEKAYPALKGFYTFADSVYADDTRAKIEELELKYAGEKKDQEIDFLKKEQELQAQQQLWLLAGLASLFLLTAIIVYAFFNAKRANQKLQIAQEKAQELIQEKEALIEQLKQTQIQLIQKEKMASLGQLSAGIAHEIN